MAETRVVQFSLKVSSCLTVLHIKFEDTIQIGSPRAKLFNLHLNFRWDWKYETFIVKTF